MKEYVDFVGVQYHKAIAEEEQVHDKQVHPRPIPEASLMIDIEMRINELRLHPPPPRLSRCKSVPSFRLPFIAFFSV